MDRLSRRPNFTELDDYVFANVAGDRLDDSALRRRYIAAGDAAGLPPLRFHDLRHTAGTLLTRVRNPGTVRDVLGHAAAQQLGPNEARRVLERVG
jgi:integrase